MIRKLYKLKEYLNNAGLNIQAEKLGSIIKIAQQTHKIAPGDSLYKLSEGDLAYQKLIEKANPNISPDKLRVGQEIILPPKPTKANARMIPSTKLELHIKKYEGKPNTGKPYLVPYDDGFGNVTVGWGHNYGKGIASRYLNVTEEKAAQLLRDDIKIASDFVVRNVDTKMTQGQFDALTSLVFNAGGSQVYQTELFKAIDSGNINKAIKLFPTTLIGKNQAGLVKRRADESAMFSN